MYLPAFSHKSLRRIAPATLALLGFFAVPAFGQDYSGLVSNSPFVPSSTAAAAVQPEENVPLELRGIMIVDGKTLFSIFDPARKSGAWVGLNEAEAEYQVTAYNPSNDTVVLNFRGRDRSLVLREARIAAMPPPDAAQAQPAAPQPGPPAGQVQQLNQPEGSDPDVAETARRLRAVAEQIRQRRAMQQQGQPPQQR